MSANEITITLPNGSTRQYQRARPSRVATSIGPSSARTLSAHHRHGRRPERHPRRPHAAQGKRQAQDRDRQERRRARGLAPLGVARHGERRPATLPRTQVTFGPAVENGFYYDFKRDQGSPPKTSRRSSRDEEDRGRRPAARAHRSVAGRSASLVLEDGESFKVEHLNDIPAGDTITTYTHGTGSTSARAPRAVHRVRQGVQAHVGRRRLLEGRRAQPDAVAHLWHALLGPEGARRLPGAGRRGEEARSPQGGQGARSVLFHPSRRPCVLSRQGRSSSTTPSSSSCAATIASGFDEVITPMIVDMELSSAPDTTITIARTCSCATSTSASSA